MNAAASNFTSIDELTGRPEVKELVVTRDKIASSAAAIVVNSVESYQGAGEVLKLVKGAIERVEEERFKITRPMDAAKKAVMDFFGPVVQSLQNTEKAIKLKLIRFDDEQRRIAAEAQRRAEEDARKERERKEAQAREAQRVADEKAAAARKEAEAQRQAEETKRREADEARRRGDREAAAAAERAAADAAKAAAKQETKAEAVIANAEAKVANLQAEAQAVVAPVIEAPRVKVAGVRKTENWKFEVLDASKLKREYTCPDAEKIGKVVKALKGEAASMIGEPGALRVWCDDGIASGRA